MSVKVNNYSVDFLQFAINDNGIIELTTNEGEVRINGDLIVTGQSTSANDLDVTDNIITVNDGETGAGVTLETAGLLVDRGTLPDARFFWNESINWLNPDSGTIVAGAFTLENNLGELSALRVNAVTSKDNDDLYLLGQGTGIVSVTGTVDYEKQIWDYSGNNVNINQDITSSDQLTLNPAAGKGDLDTLVNVQGLMDYVRDYNLYNFNTKISSPKANGLTFVNTQDVTNGDPSSLVNVTVNSVSVANFTETDTFLYDFQFTNSTLTTNDPLLPLALDTQGDSIELRKPAVIRRNTSPSPVADGVALFAADEADGGTGLYFSNDNGTTDELISKNKSLLYSILF
jgi:hypothetical protein